MFQVKRVKRAQAPRPVMGKHLVGAGVRVHRPSGRHRPSMKATWPHMLSRVRWRFALERVGQIGQNLGQCRRCTLCLGLGWAGLGCACGQELHFKMLTASFHSSIFCLVVRVVEGAVCLPLEAPSIRAAKLASCMQPTAHHWGQVRGVLPAAGHSVNDPAAQSQQAVPCAAAAVHAH